MGRKKKVYNLPASPRLEPLTNDSSTRFNRRGTTDTRVSVSTCSGLSFEDEKPPLAPTAPTATVAEEKIYDGVETTETAPEPSVSVGQNSDMTQSQSIDVPAVSVDEEEITEKVEEDQYMAAVDSATEKSAALSCPPPSYQEASQNIPRPSTFLVRSYTGSSQKDTLPLTGTLESVSETHASINPPSPAPPKGVDRLLPTQSAASAARQAKNKARRASSVHPDYEIKKVHVAPVAKFYLFFSTLLAAVIGLGMAGIGSYASITQGTFTDLSGFGADPAALLIAAGCFILLLGCCGLIGSLREHLLLLRIFHITLLVLLLAELTGGLLIYFLQQKVKDAAASQVIVAIEKYQTTPLPTALDDAIIQVQIRFQCCGANHPRDWRDNSRYYDCTSKEVFESLASACGVPSSCCQKGAATNTQCGYKVFAYPNMTAQEMAKYPRIGDREVTIWSAGCINAIYDWLRSHWKTLAIVSGGVLLLELLGIEAARKMLESLYTIKRKGHL